jgi:hypothetical protein
VFFCIAFTLWFTFSVYLLTGNSSSSGPAPLNKNQQTPHGIAMLQQLIAESDHKSVVFSDDLSTQTREQQLKGLQACQDDDVIYDNWRISLVNSQVSKIFGNNFKALSFKPNFSRYFLKAAKHQVTSS